MISREEKNKVIQKKIQKEKNLLVSKKLVKTIIMIIIMLLTVYLLLRFWGTSYIKTHEFMIKDAQIPPNFQGVKILHFSDLLYGSTTDDVTLNILNKEFEKINPDIVIFTGDIIDKNYKLEKNKLDSLKNFFQNIPYTIGKYSVKGDYDTSTFDLIMNEADFRILDNSYELLYYKENTPIALMGFKNDGNYNFDTSSISDLYKISLIHNYDNLKTTYTSNIILAGHNLGGELYLPYYGGLLGNNRYNNHYYYINDQKVFISNGIGSIHKIRSFNHPSVNVYRLISK